MYEMGYRFQNLLNEGGKDQYFENLYLYVTNECDKFCRHCYLGNRLVKREIMPIEMTRNHMQFWRSLGASKICFLGGEPTFYQHLHDSVEYAYELGYEKILINTNLSSNAYKVISSFEPGEFTYIQTSLDGATKETHDSIRGKGSFEETIDSVCRLAARGDDIRIIMTVNEMNKHEVIPMIELAEQLGCTLVKFHIMSEIGNADQELHMGTSPVEWLNICRSIRRYAEDSSQRKIRISYQPSYDNKKNPDHLIQKGYPGCVGVNMERISIFPDGKCYICSFLFDSNDSFAALKGQTIDINDSALDGDFKNPACGDCQATCGYDGCVAENYIYKTDFCNEYQDIYPVCRLWKIEV